MGKSRVSRLVPIVAILAVFSIPLSMAAIPILAILEPILSDLVPLAYIITTFCLGTVCGRHLLGYHHELKMEELERQAELTRLEAEKYKAAESLIASDDPVERKVKEIEAKQKA